MGSSLAHVWENSAPHCSGKASTRIPDQRTLESPTEKTKYEYLKLPNDVDFFPCNLRRILITKTYTSLYALLCATLTHVPGVASCSRGLYTAYFTKASNLSLRPRMMTRLRYSCRLRRPNPKQGAISTHYLSEKGFRGWHSCDL